jgi:hypothetical protein
VRLEAGERGVEVAPVYLERGVLHVGVADVGVDRGQEVQRPAPRGREPDGGAGYPFPADFDFDLVAGRLRQGHPHLAGERAPVRIGEQPGGADQPAALVGDPGPRRRRVEAGDGDPHKVGPAVRLGVQGRGPHLDPG